MNAPIVSVLMPIYNNTSYARAAIQSILDQTMSDFEFIIVDDGSDIDTQNLLAKFEAIDERIVLLRNETNLGLTPSLNRALAIAQGEYVARQDADDISMPKRLEIQVSYLQSQDKVGILGTAYKVIDRDDNPIAEYHVPLTDTAIRWQMLFHSSFCHAGIVIRRSLFVRNKLKYDEDYLHIEDYELWTRILSITMGANLPDPLFCVRKHDESVSAKNRDSQYERATCIAERQVRQVWSNHPFSLSEIDTLRQWYNRFPRQLTKQDMILCRYFLHLIAIFSQQPNIDSSTMDEINLYWTRRILCAVHRPAQWADLVSTGLLNTLLRYSLTETMTIIPSWLGRTAKRRLHILPKANSQED